MDMRSWQNLPADQIAAKLMEAYPNVNPAPMVAQLQTPQSDAMDMLPAPGEKFVGPQGPLGGPAQPQANPFAMLGAVQPLFKPQGQPTPQGGGVRMGGGAAPASPGTYPASGPIRRRSQSLGEILGGLK